MDGTEDEIEAIQAMYAGEGEFELIQKGDGVTNPAVVRLNLNLMEHDTTGTLSLTLTLPPTYPKIPPEMCITSSELTRKKAIQMKEDLLQHCQSLLNEPMVMDIVSWIQDHFIQYRTSGQKEEQTIDEQTEKLQTCLLHLDHMRARGRYVKTIQKWTEELGLTGRLLFLDKLILILLQGRSCDIKDYIQRQRTVNVDVDSKGRSCKERMLRVVTEEPLVAQQRSQKFLVEECSHVDELCEIFRKMHLENIYSEHVQSLLKR